MHQPRSIRAEVQVQFARLAMLGAHIVYACTPVKKMLIPLRQPHSYC